MRVISKDEEKILWDKLNNEFKFKPGTDIIGAVSYTHLTLPTKA